MTDAVVKSSISPWSSKAVVLQADMILHLSSEVPWPLCVFVHKFPVNQAAWGLYSCVSGAEKAERSISMVLWDGWVQDSSQVRMILVVSLLATGFPSSHPSCFLPQLSSGQLWGDTGLSAFRACSILSPWLQGGRWVSVRVCLVSDWHYVKGHKLQRSIHWHWHAFNITKGTFISFCSISLCQGCPNPCLGARFGLRQDSSIWPLG